MKNYCPLCGSKKVKVIHKGVRDNEYIDVYECMECSMVFLENIEDDEIERKYEKSEMHKSQYNIWTETVQSMNWETWVESTKSDDERRTLALNEICDGKDVLDFGCGNGGFLRRIIAKARTASGVELETAARAQLEKEGLTVKKRIAEYGDRKWDVITMFHVIEHLQYPDIYLQEISSALRDEGMLIVETPNASDALISMYNCEDFKDYTYWSNHVRLYNYNTLALLMRKNGFEMIRNISLQRYPLANHLYWLTRGKPGGHVKWKELNDKELNKMYQKKLYELGICDTVYMEFKKT